MEIIDTKITENWGVQWNEMETARDFLQNFYDANELDEIKVNIENNKILVEAPAVFDWQELLFFGSDKADDDAAVGQYGEGFKAALLNAMRNWGCKVKVQIGNILLSFFFENIKIGKTTKRVVKVKKSSLKAIEGSKLSIEEATTNLCNEFKIGLNYFYSKSNPLFGELLVTNYEKDLQIYECTQKTGYLFYGKIMRSHLDLPIIIVCNRVYKNIEAKIAHDRDRKAFNEEVQKRLFSAMFKNFTPINLLDYLRFTKDFWQKQNKTMSSIAYACCNYHFHNFPKEYFAKSNAQIKNPFLLDEIDKVKEEFKEKELIECPAYMALFGMNTAEKEAQERLKEKADRYAKITTHTITRQEMEALLVPIEFATSLAPDLAKHFKSVLYTIGYSDDILGELKANKDYRTKHVFLNIELFKRPFSQAVALVLHEWSHIYGYDGSREFSDALTDIIAEMLQQEELLKLIKDYEKLWEKKCKMVEISTPIEISGTAHLQAMTKQELIEWITQMQEMISTK